jgi:hypothetical protein
MSDNICEFCGKSFSSVYNLRVHINTAKYCLADRKESGICYICDYCECKFTRKSALFPHQKICIKYKDYIIETKDKEIIALNEKNTKRIQELEKKHEKESEELKAKIIKLEETITFGKGYVEGCKTVKPSKITNNTTHNTLVQKLEALPVTTIEPFTISLVKNNLEKYTYEMYKRAELGVVDFITDITILEMEDGTIEKNYVSCDLSRNAFHRLVVGKKWKLDGGAKFLNVVLDQLILKATKYYGKLREEIDNLSIDNPSKEFKSKLDTTLRSFFNGVIGPKSKERVAVLSKIRSVIKNNNHIDVLNIDQ